MTAREESKVGRAEAFPNLVALIQILVLLSGGGRVGLVATQTLELEVHMARTEGCWVQRFGKINSYVSRYLTLHWKASPLPRMLCSLSFHAWFLLVMYFS